MGASDRESRCQAAAEYYYDLLHDDDATIPEWVWGHVESCPFCREQMRRLGEMLSEANRDAGLPARRTAEETVGTLTGHLNLLDEPVTCAHVKSFLPSLAAPAPAIRIPTPVTAHAECCPQCREDLAALRALGLRADQLERLSRVFRESPRQNLRECRRAWPAVAALGSFSLGAADTWGLTHISTCPRCRAAVYWRRRRFPEAAPAEAMGPGATSCTRLSTADLFDLVVPYGRMPAGAEEDREIFRHVRACPACVERIQTLHRTVYGIAERADSGVTTVYRTRDAAERGAGETDDVPPRYPVHVQIARRGPAPGSADLPAARRPDAAHQSAGSRRISLAKIVFAAAAFALVSLLFTTTPTASGTNVGDILKAIQRQPNVRVLSFRANGPEPFQIICVARGLNVLLTESGNERVLFDFNERSKTTVDLDRGTYVSIPLAGPDYRGAREAMMGYARSIFAGIPSDTRLQAATDPADASGSRTLVYEVSTTAQTNYYGENSAVSYRYRISIDRATKLPQRLDSFRSSPREGSEWKLVTFYIFEYVSERDVKDAIKAMCFEQ